MNKWQEYWYRCMTHAAPELMIKRIVNEERAEQRNEIVEIIKSCYADTTQKGLVLQRIKDMGNE